MSKIDDLKYKTDDIGNIVVEKISQMAKVNCIKFESSVAATQLFFPIRSIGYSPN